MATAFGNSLTSSQANMARNYSYDSSMKAAYLQKTTPVGSYQPNAWGLYDTLGNVCEWCWDWYDPGYYAKSPLNDPRGGTTGSSRVMRGHSWSDDGYYLRSAIRDSISPDFRVNSIGFRVVVGQ